MAKRASFGNVVLKKLSDITNLQTVKYTSTQDEKPMEISDSDKDKIDQLVKVWSYWVYSFFFPLKSVTYFLKVGFLWFEFLNQERMSLLKLLAERKYSSVLLILVVCFLFSFSDFYYRLKNTTYSCYHNFFVKFVSLISFEQ